MPDLLDVLQRLAERRLDPEEVRAGSSFRADVARQWHPATAAERRVARRSRLVHLVDAATYGGVTLGCVGVSGLLTAVGSAILTVAPPSPRPEYDLGVPSWVQATLTVGLLAVAVQCAASPRRLHRVWFSLAAMVLAVGSFAAIGLAHVQLAIDRLLMVAVALIGIACVAATVGLALRLGGLVQRALRVLGLGSLGICACDAAWVLLFALDRTPLLAVACACSAIGAVLMANGLLFARPAIGGARGVR